MRSLYTSGPQQEINACSHFGANRLIDQKFISTPALTESRIGSFSGILSTGYSSTYYMRLGSALLLGTAGLIPFSFNAQCGCNVNLSTPNCKVIISPGKSL